MHLRFKRTLIKLLPLFVVLALMAPAPLFVDNSKAAPYVNNRSLKMSSSLPSATGVSYELSFDVPAMPTLGAIKLNVCSNSPLPEDFCAGFSGSGLSSISSFSINGASGFSILGSPTQTEIILSRSPQPTTAGPLIITLRGVGNPAATGSYYGRLELFADQLASTTALYAGGTAIAITQPVDVSTYVPPYLYFCAAINIQGLDCTNLVDYYYDFGEFNSRLTRYGHSQFITATNAGFGYNVTYHGTTMTSGNNIIDPIPTLDTSQIGRNQFGLNLRRNTAPSVGEEPTGYGPYPTIRPNYNQPNRFMFNSGDQLVSINQPSYFTKYTVAYIVNVNSSQAPGVYSTTMLYLALANF